MGENGGGELGDGTWTDRSNPVRIVESGVTYVRSGQNDTLFVKDDGSLWGVGTNQDGQLGIGSTVKQHTPVKVISSGVKIVAVGGYHTLFIKTDGSLWAMGMFLWPSGQ